ncbi:unnamed protein product, partial [Heterosigma akashiwo]
HLCRCPCGNVLKPKHVKSQNTNPYKTYYPNKNTAHPTISGKERQSPQHPRTPSFFFLEPLVRRSTALMSANCTRTRTQLVTVERGFCHFA